MYSGNLRSAIALAACAATAACSTYTPVPVTAALQDQTVRVDLTSQGMVSLGSDLGGGAAQVEGRIVSASDSTLTISVAQLTRLSGVEETWNGENVTIPVGEVAQVAHEQRSVGRSVLLAGLFGGGVYLLGKSLGSGNATGSQTTYGGSVR